MSGYNKPSHCKSHYEMQIFFMSDLVCYSKTVQDILIADCKERANI